MLEPGCNYCNSVLFHSQSFQIHKFSTHLATLSIFCYWFFVHVFVKMSHLSISESAHFKFCSRGFSKATCLLHPHGYAATTWGYWQCAVLKSERATFRVWQRWLINALYSLTPKEQRMQYYRWNMCTDVRWWPLIWFWYMRSFLLFFFLSKGTNVHLPFLFFIIFFWPLSTNSKYCIRRFATGFQNWTFCCFFPSFFYLRTVSLRRLIQRSEHDSNGYVLYLM